MIILENPATSALGRPGRRDIEVCIEGVRRATAPSGCAS